MLFTEPAEAHHPPRGRMRGHPDDMHLPTARDLARLANCNTAVPTGVGVPFRACAGNDAALAAEVRFRARFNGF